MCWTIRSMHPSWTWYSVLVQKQARKRLKVNDRFAKNVTTWPPVVPKRPQLRYDVLVWNRTIVMRNKIQQSNSILYVPFHNHKIQKEQYHRVHIYNLNLIFTESVVEVSATLFCKNELKYILFFMSVRRLAYSVKNNIYTFCFQYIEIILYLKKYIIKMLHCTYVKNIFFI